MQVVLCTLSVLFSWVWNYSGSCEGHLPSKDSMEVVGHIGTGFGEVLVHSCSHQNSLLKSYEVCIVYYLHWANKQNSGKEIT